MVEEQERLEYACPSTMNFGMTEIGGEVVILKEVVTLPTYEDDVVITDSFIDLILNESSTVSIDELSKASGHESVKPRRGTVGTNTIINARQSTRRRRRLRRAAPAVPVAAMPPPPQPELPLTPAPSPKPSEDCSEDITPLYASPTHVVSRSAARRRVPARKGALHNCRVVLHRLNKQDLSFYGVRMKTKTRCHGWKCEGEFKNLIPVSTAAGKWESVPKDVREPEIAKNSKNSKVPIRYPVTTRCKSPSSEKNLPKCLTNVKRRGRPTVADKMKKYAVSSSAFRISPRHNGSKPSEVVCQTCNTRVRSQHYMMTHLKCKPCHP